MLWPERLFPNCQRALVERLGLGIFALIVEQPRQVVEAQSQIGMLWPERLFPNCERL